jgi:hypothetical protein
MPRPRKLLERLSYPEFDQRKGKERRGTEWEREGSDDNMSPASVYNRDVEQAQLYTSNQPEGPMPVDSVLDRDDTLPMQEPENSPDVVEAVQETDDGSEVNWEECYENPDDAEVSPPATGFRIANQNFPDYDPSSDPLNADNPWR